MFKGLVKSVTIFPYSILALTNYQISRYVTFKLQALIPGLSYPITLSILWLLTAIIPIIILKQYSGLRFDLRQTKKNIFEIAIYIVLIIIGLALFSYYGKSDYFHYVKYPMIFFIITPIVEELIFRSWLFAEVKRLTKFSPVLITSILFAIQHLQYYNFTLTWFAQFQIEYTFFLGLVLARLRLKSGSIYIPLAIHMLINYLVLRI